MKTSADHSISVELSRALTRERGVRTLAFTLIEFILVMALLAVVMAFSAPSLSRFFRQRHLEEEAMRFLALTEHGRNEAISQGLPMVIWIDPETQEYGMEAKPGFPVQAARSRQFALHPDIQFETETTVSTREGWLEVAEFEPDGTLGLDSLEMISLVDRKGRGLILSQTTNQWGYEILNPTDYASRTRRR